MNSLTFPRNIPTPDYGDDRFRRGLCGAHTQGPHRPTVCQHYFTMLERNPFRMKSAWAFFCSISMGPPSAAWMLWAYLLTRFASFPIAASMALCTWIKALSHYPKPCLGCCLFQKLSAFLVAFFLNLVASCCLLGPQAAQQETNNSDTWDPQLRSRAFCTISSNPCPLRKAFLASLI